MVFVDRAEDSVERPCNQFSERIDFLLVWLGSIFEDFELADEDSKRSVVICEHVVDDDELEVVMMSEEQLVKTMSQISFILLSIYVA